MSLQSVLLLATLCGFASALVFEDASTDGVVVESSAIPAGDPNVDTRLLGGLLGGIKKKELCLINCGPGNPALSYQCCSFGYAQCCYGNAGGYGGYGGVKPGKCPGLLGLGTNVLAGGVPYGGAGYGSVPYGGAGYGGAGYGGAGYGGAGYGGYPGGYSNGYPQTGHIQTGFNPGYGGIFRSADKDASELAADETSGVKDASAVKFRSRRQSVSVDSADVPSAGAEGGQVNPRFLGLFGQKCSFDIHCPGQLKCCFNGIKSTCQQPSIFGF